MKRSLSMSFVLLLVGCAPQRFLLVQPPSVSPGPMDTYQCTAGSTEPCKQIAPPPEESFGMSSTARVILPAPCATRIHRVLVQDAQSSTSTVIVQCAAPGGDPGMGTTTLPPGQTAR